MTTTPDKRARLGLLAICLATFMLLLDLTVINVALPDIQASLHASFEDLQWTIDAYASSLAAFLLVAGVCADRYGRRSVFVVGIVGFTLASAASALAQSALWLIAARAGQGVGGAVMLAAAPALISQEFSGADRDRAFVAFGGSSGLAIATGPIIGGALTDIDWTWIFWVNVPVGVLCALLALNLRNERDTRGRLGAGSLVSGALLCAAVFCGIYALTHGDRKGWGSSSIVVTIVLAVVLTAAFFWLQRRPSLHVVDTDLLRSRSMVGLNAATLLANAAIFPIILFTVLYLQRLQGYSPFGTGLRLLVLTGALFVGSALATPVSARYSRPAVLAAALSLTGVGLVLLVLLGADSGWGAMAPGLAVAGLGVGLFNVVRAEGTVALVEDARAGMASGLGSTFQEIGVAVGVAGFGSLFDHQFLSRLVDRGVTGYDASELSAAADRLSQLRHAGPRGLRVVNAVESAFVDTFHLIVLSCAAAAFVAAAVVLLTVRERDFAPRASSARTATTDQEVMSRG